MASVIQNKKQQILITHRASSFFPCHFFLFEIFWDFTLTLFPPFCLCAVFYSFIPLFLSFFISGSAGCFVIFLGCCGAKKGDILLKFWHDSKVVKDQKKAQKTEASILVYAKIQPDRRGENLLYPDWNKCKKAWKGI